MDNKKRAGRATSSQMSRVCCGDQKTIFKYYKTMLSFTEGKRSLKNFTTEKEAEDYKLEKKEGVVVKVVPDPPKKFYTYVEEVAVERYLGRTSSTEVKTRPMLWGSLMEVVLFNELGLGWTMEHKNTVTHYKYGNIWSGTPDLVAKLICAEAKCYEPKKFGSFVYALLKQDIQYLKDNFADEYWQVISNTVLTKKEKSMLITFMPKRTQLESIIKTIDETDFLEDNGLKPTDYYFMAKENIESLAYLPDDSKCDSINAFEFTPPKEDIKFMEDRIILFEKEVKKYEEVFK